jgi:hypothetical protein
MRKLLIMNTHADKKEKNKRQSAANVVTKKQSGNASTFQFVDNRPEAVTQRKLQEITTNNAKNKLSESVWETSKSTAQLKLIEQSSISNVVQLGRKRKKPDDSDDEYVPPSKRRKHRHTFSKKLRRTVIRKAPKNKSGLHVCPGCGMPLADRKGREIKTYYTSKSKKRHNIVSGQLDHYPPWNKRLKKLERQKKSEEAIKKEHNDPTKLRPLCLRCNASHKFENTKDLPESGFSDEEYYSDDEARDKEIWKPFRKDDRDPPPGGSGVTA